MSNGHILYSTSSAAIEKSPSPQKGKDDQVADTKILGTLASYLWMKDNPEFRLRVLTALGFLVGAKASIAASSFLVSHSILLSKGLLFNISSASSIHSIRFLMYKCPSSSSWLSTG